VGTNEAPALAADWSPTSTLDATADGKTVMGAAVALGDGVAVGLGDVAAVGLAD
jgi:hypothetical protein